MALMFVLLLIGERRWKLCFHEVSAERMMLAPVKRALGYVAEAPVRKAP